MFISNILATSDPNEAGPPTCKPFTLKSNVCVGDLIVIIACTIAGFGFFFWSIHAIHKMRKEFPFTYDPEKEELNDDNIRNDPFYIPINLDNTSTTLSMADRVRIRMMLTHPEEDIYQPMVCDVERYAKIPCMPPRAEMPSWRDSVHTQGRYGSLKRGGSGERYGYKYGINEDGMRKDELLAPSYTAGNSFRSYQGLKGHMNGDSTTHDT